MNHIIVSIDCARVDTVGLYSEYTNGHMAEMPFLKGLSGKSTLYSDAFTQATCTPGSHASMLTGLNPPGHGIRKMYGQGLSDNVKTIAYHLKNHKSAAFVNAIALAKSYGLARDFDSYVVSKGDPKTITNLCAQFIQSCEEEFFILVHYYTAHGIGVPTYKQHLDGLEKIDKELLKLFSFFPENTAVYICSDHGDDLDHLYEDDHGKVLSEATIRVPLVINIPDIEINDCNSVARLIDIPATILDIEGIDIKLNGVSFADKNRVTRYAYCEAPKTGKYCIRNFGMKFWFDALGVLESVFICDGMTEQKIPERLHEGTIRNLIGHAKVIASGIRDSSNVYSGFEDALVRERLANLGYV